MGTWSRALDAAGVRDAALREDYTRDRRLVAGYRRSAYVAVRVLLAPPLQPSLLTVTAFMHRTDTLLDSGPEAGRAEAFARWEKRVREGLDGGSAGGDPGLRALLHTVAARPWLRGRIEDFLAAAPLDLDFAGFADEADYQRYVERYALPAFMLIAGLVAGEDAPEGYPDACRTFIDGSQRLDFANDIAEDLRGGRLAIPRQTLDAYGVTRADLEQARDTPGVRDLLAHVLDRARHSLAAGRTLAGLVPPEGRALFRGMVEIEDLTAAAAAAKGAALLKGSARPSPPATVRVLLRERRAARRAT